MKVRISVKLVGRNSPDDCLSTTVREGESLAKVLAMVLGSLSLDMPKRDPSTFLSRLIYEMDECGVIFGDDFAPVLEAVAQYAVEHDAWFIASRKLDLLNGIKRNKALKEV